MTELKRIGPPVLLLSGRVETGDTIRVSDEEAELLMEREPDCWMKPGEVL
jgi:hypothetical protein